MAITTIFTIGGTVVAQPQALKPIPRVQIGKTLQGSVIWQGYPGLEITYNYLLEADMTQLQAMYDETRQRVTLVYGNPVSGSAITRTANWDSIEIGGVMPRFYTDVVLKFSRLGTAQ